MPPYATVWHVAAVAAGRGPFTATSIPNATQVAMYIEHAQGEVDGILAADGYAVPVAAGATLSLKLLERLVTVGAWAQVEQTAKVSDDLDRVVKMWEKARKELAEGTVQLPDAPRLAGMNFARAGAQGSPFFSRDMAL